jgi:hypothetical protein
MSYEEESANAEYSWPEWWKNEEGEWPPSPIPSDVTAEYNYPYLYNSTFPSHHAHYYYVYERALTSDLFPVGVDWDWGSEEGDLRYIWYQKNTAWQGEYSFYWDGTFVSYPTKEDREMSFWIEQWSVSQEADRVVVELGDNIISRDFVTFGEINYPYREDAYQDITVTLSLSTTYWNRPSGSGSQEIVWSPIVSSSDVLPGVLINGLPLYINPLGLDVEPDFNHEFPAGFYQYSYVAGVNYIDLRSGFM